MNYFAGLDVSVKETDVCIVDGTGRLVRKVKVASELEALLPVVTNPIYRLKQIGLEVGPLSRWLFSALAEAGLPVICVETRHMRAVLKAQINKTDRNAGVARAVAHWALSSLREKLIKIGAKVVHYARYAVFQMAEVAVPRELFEKILRLIERLRTRPAPA